MRNLRFLIPCLAFAFSAMAQESKPVRFSWGTEVFPNNFKTRKQDIPVSNEELVRGKFVRYIQFNKTLNSSESSALRALGIDVVTYIYPATYLLMLPESIDFQQLDRFNPISVVPLKPEWKMAKSLRETPYGVWAVHGEWLDINIQVYPNISIEEGAARCRENGMIVRKEGTQNGFIQVSIRQDELVLKAGLPFIQYLELASPPATKDDTRGRSLHRSNMLDVAHPLGKKFNGAGVRTLVRDDGQLGPHIDFQGRLTNLADAPASSGNHGDAVGGILGGAGNLDPTKKGMAAGAEIFSLDVDQEFQDATLFLHLNEGITLTNTSYSSGCNTGYTLAAQTVDKQLFEHPTFMHVFSSGNSGLNDCNYGAGATWGNITGGHKMAKNCITVGNVLQDGTLDATSSRGPAHDGRLKPDICANGKQQFSTAINNTYIEFGGTSGAAPGIVGCLAQLTQAYKSFHGGQEPNASLLKAAILNTANDLGNAGPDFKFGWGGMNAFRAFQLLEQNRYTQAQVDQGAEMTHVVDIPANTRLARVMIVWADPPANAQAARALINDLDIRIVSASGTEYLPWKLNAAPTAAALNSPAVKGRDSLNNVEQVSINDPVPGIYTVKVKGTDVPTGPQEYQLVWEFLTDDVKLTYPAGGEGFVTGEQERLHWDAFGTISNFTLSYSTDGGANFSTITTLSGDKRMYDWTIPNTISGTVKLLLTRDMSRDTVDFPLSIVPVPQNLVVEKVCPDSMTLSWDKVNDSLSYDVYMLGAKYMELIGSSNTNRLTFPISNAGLARWLAVRSSHPNGIQGRRSIAVNWPGKLVNCPQDRDIWLNQLLDPVGDAIVFCSASPQPVSVRIKNSGLSLSTGATISYQVNNEPIVSETQPDILPGDSLNFSFQTPISISTNGIISLKIWSEYPGDVTHYNDTLSLTLPVVANAISTVFVEDFEAVGALPFGWVVNNPDGKYTWKLTNNYPDLIGKDGTLTRAIFLNHYQYQEKGAEDYLYMIPVNLDSIKHPSLVFDLAHRRFNETDQEGLRVELFPSCDLGAQPVVIYEKFDPELSTLSTSTVFFVPDSASNWKRQVIDLEAFKGQSVVIRFVSINGYGNNTFLDNIGIEEFEAPFAEILNPADTVCRNQSTIFLANTMIPNTQYFWNFATTSAPQTASGSGPHSVIFTTQGTKTIRLFATNANGSDTTFHNLMVLPFPASNFSNTANNLSVSFTSTSTNASFYLWNFGDGMNSSLQNPVHDYAVPGTYNVVLTAGNQCSTATKTKTITLTSRTKDLSKQMSISVLPNPSAGDFVVRIESQVSENIQLHLVDTQGRLVKAINSTVKQGLTNIPIESLKLPKGIYQLNLIGKSGQTTLNVIIQ